MSKSKIEQDESPETVKNWAKMMVSPDLEMVMSPSSSPYLASQARITKSYDFKATGGNEGKFTYVISPDPSNAVAIPGDYTHFPTIGSGLLLDQSKADSKVDQPFAGWFGGDAVATAIGADEKSYVRAIQSGGFLGFPVVVEAGSTIEITIGRSNNQSTLVFVALFGDGTSANMFVGRGLFGSAEYTIPAGKTTAMIGCYETVGGVATSSNHAVRIGYSIPNGVLNYPAIDSILPLFKSTLLEQGKIETVKPSAICLLVTNMATPLESGGELVVARVARKVVATATETLSSTIKQLPEQLYWRSGAIQDGGRAWWLPDDISSYEPKTLGSSYASDENVLVATGQTSAAGYLRLQITWIYEFYTPAQVFARRYGPVLIDHYREVWKVLSQQPAVSANAGHFALAKMIGTAVANYVVGWVSDPANQAYLRRLISEKFDKRTAQVAKPTKPDYAANAAKNQANLKKNKGQPQAPPRSSGLQRGTKSPS